MSTTLIEQITQLEQAIAELEARRSILGDEAVEAALLPSRKKLADLEAQIASQGKEPIQVPQRKRKLVTLLYLDVVGSTAMTQNLDPEDNLELMEKALLRLIEPIQEHGGRITRYTGDGFKAVFGDPTAREDDPEQAIWAGLEILDISKKVAQEIEKEWEIEGFQVRIGIDTGLAALGGETEGENTVKGRVVNLAVRIESAAPPGGLLISHNTYRHVRGVFNVDPLEPIKVKGFPEPAAVYLVKEIKPRAFRVRTLGVEGVETRMIGRRTELDILKDALMTAIEEGEGQVITLSGEAGIGKSRLLYEYQNWIELLPQTVRLFQGRCRQESHRQPYSLLRDVFAFRFQIQEDNLREQARHKIEAGFGNVFGDDENALMKSQIIGHLLGFDYSSSSHLKGVLKDAEQLRNRGLMYLIQYFQALSQEMPVVIFLEDTHWGDDSSMDLVCRIGEFSPQHPILIVCAARPVLFERRPYWGEGQTYHSCIELHPLSKRENRQLVAEILKLAVDIPVKLRELVVRGAEGNPFYTEELIKMLIEDGVIIPGEETWLIDETGLGQVDVPSTLAGVLQARLDSLPNYERTVLQQASVVGRLFWDRIVTYIQTEAGEGGDPGLIPLALTSLRDRELVYRHEESVFAGSVEYLFKHDMLREVTYESVIKQLRQTYHGLVADWLIANCGDRICEYYGQIAEHLLSAGKRDQAGQYFAKAGELALASFANIEAELYFQKALSLSPQESIRAGLLTGLGEATYRQGDSEQAEQLWRQAIDLYKDLENYDQLADVYARLSSLLWHQNNLEAWNLCLEGLDLIKDSPDSVGHARLLAEAGRTAHFRSEIDQIAPLCQKAIKMSQRTGNVEVQADALTTMGLYVGNYEDAMALYKDVIHLGEKNNLLRSKVRALNYLGWIEVTNLIDLKSGLDHYLCAAEFGKSIGESHDTLAVLLANAYSVSIDLGEWAKVEGKIEKILCELPGYESTFEKILRGGRPDLLSARGEWVLALEKIRELRQEARKGYNNQGVAWSNLGIIDTILEINHFNKLEDLSEARTAAKEVLEIKVQHKRAAFKLAVIFVRMNELTQAHDWFERAKNINYKCSENLVKELCNSVEFEIAIATSRWDEALTACVSSINIYKNCHYKWMWARRLIDLGDVLTYRSESGDRERACITYQQSLDMFTEMGMPVYVKVLEERLGEL